MTLPLDKLYIRAYTMRDEEFLDLLAQYLEPPAQTNPAMVNVEIVWERDNPAFGSKHIWEDHRVTEQEVEQVLFEVPPYVEAKRHPDHPGRTLFWGATRHDRYIFVVCEDWSDGGRRYLRPVTAFEPEEGRVYWEKQL